MAEGVPPELVSHKIFEGNRPSTQILIGEMTPFTVRVPCPFSFTKLAVQHGGLRVSLFETAATEKISLDAPQVGQLLGISEHRTVVQGFLWGINSFDQW